MKDFFQLREEKETVVKRVKNKANDKSVMITRLANGKFHVYKSKSSYERGKQNERMVMVTPQSGLDAESAVSLFNKEKKKAWKK